MEKERGSTEAKLFVDQWLELHRAPPVTIRVGQRSFFITGKMV
jgi:hypothetical protein